MPSGLCNPGELPFLMTTPSPEASLDELRREIDAIDDAILDLLARRFAATGKVKSAKARDGSIAVSPLRPGREAALLRRLIDRSRTSVPAETIQDVWRVILSSSTLSQAPVLLHLDQRVGSDLELRLLLSSHFRRMAVKLHDDPSAAIAALRANRGDLAVIATGSDWTANLPADATDGARVIVTLPIIGPQSAPQLLVFGHAEPAATGEDETLVVTAGTPPQTAPTLWQARSGRHTLSAFPGFLMRDDPVIAALRLHNPEARIAGQYPRPLKVVI